MSGYRCQVGVQIWLPMGNGRGWDQGPGALNPEHTGAGARVRDDVSAGPQGGAGQAMANCTSIFSSLTGAAKGSHGHLRYLPGPFSPQKHREVALEKFYARGCGLHPHDLLNSQRPHS